MATSLMSRRTAMVAGGVVLMHAAALWGLNAGLLSRPAEVVVPVQMVGELITPAEPRVQPAPAPQPRPQPPAHQLVARKTPVPSAPAPRRVAPRQPRSPIAPVAVAESQPPAPPAPLAPAVAPAPAPAAEAPPASAPARVELPSTSAEYLQNPAPTYPPASRRAGEQGKVIVRVLIGTDGMAREAELRQSSGYERLDRAALETVRKWRYVPGKRNGMPEAMWFNVPINFVLE